MLALRDPNPSSWETVIDGCLSETAVVSLFEYISNNGTFSAEVNNPDRETGLDQDIRVSDICWIDAKEETQEIYYDIAHKVELVNNGKYSYSLSFIESLQYSEYPEGGHYTWHVDSTLKDPEGQNRKLSFSILLNDDFEGGDLEIFAGPEPVSIPMKKNQILFFPSYLLHRVAPVTKGTRKALVGWVRGPDFV